MNSLNDFWGISVANVIRMEYVNLAKTISQASGGLSETAIVVEVTKRRKASDSDAEILACSRIISAFIEGPDVLEQE